jgi:glycosyltransferase involved in cell wall biosynthesis
MPTGLQSIETRAASPRNVAMLCYYFPPLGGGGTPRSVKLVKYLGCFGYRPIVLTADHAASAFKREFQPDHTFERDLAGVDYRCVRIASPATDRLARWQRKRWYRWLWASAYPWVREAQRPWALAAARWLCRLPPSQRPALLYASAAPTSALEAAARASRAIGVPWIADLRDLWTQDTIAFYPSRWHYRWECHLERAVLCSAEKIIANTPLAAQTMRGWLGPELAERVVVIPNGFDPEDIRPRSATSDAEPANGSETAAPDRPITIVHAGTLHDPGIVRSRLGRYRPAAIDATSRTLRPLLRGLEALQALDRSTASRLRIRQLGFAPEGARRDIEHSSLKGLFSLEGCLRRDEALAAIRQADVQLVLPLAWTDSARPMTKIPGKVYDALATGQPILAPTGCGDLKDLLARAPQAYVCDYRDPVDVAGALARLAFDLDAQRVGHADPEWIAQFDRRVLAQKMARVFDEALGVPSPPPDVGHAAYTILGMAGAHEVVR